MADSTATTRSILLLPNPASGISRRFLKKASKPLPPWVQFVRNEENGVYYNAVAANAGNCTTTDLDSMEDGDEAGTNSQVGLPKEARRTFDLAKEMRCRREAYEASLSGLVAWFGR